MEENTYLEIIVRLAKNTKQTLQSSLSAMKGLWVGVKAKLNRAESKAEIKKDLAGLTGLNVKVKGKLDKKSTNLDIKEQAKSLNDIYLNATVKLDKRKAQKEIDKDIASITAGQHEIKVTPATSTVESAPVSIPKSSGFSLTKIKDSVSAIFGMEGTVRRFAKLIGDATRQLKAVDTQMTEISKTSNLTEKEMLKLGNGAFDSANKFGQSVNKYLEGANTFAQAGKKNVAALAELSLMAQSAGNMEASLADEYLLATDAAYGFRGSVEKLTQVLDGQNQVTNRNAVDMSKIAEAVKITGSQAAQSSVEIDEMTSVIATMATVTQMSGSEVGRAFKGILMNLQKVKGEVVDGEIIDEEALSKSEKALASVGISLKEVHDDILTLRNPMEVIKELSAAFMALDENDARRANIIESIGGKYRGNQLTALLSNYDMYEKILNDYQDSTGSALRESQKTANSWEGLQNQLSNSWIEFVGGFVNTDWVKGGMSGLNSMVQALDGLNKAGAFIPALTGSVVALQATLNKNFGITQIKNQATGKIDIQGNMFGVDFTAMAKQKQHFSDAASMIQKWNAEIKAGTADISSFGGELVKNNETFKTYLSTTKNGNASLAGYKASLNAAGISTDALRLKTVALNAILGMGIGLAINAIVSGIGKLITAQQDAIDVATEARKAFDSQSDSIRSNVDTLKGLESEFKSLSKGVDDYGNNISLSADEYSRYQSIVEKIVGISPELITGYDAEGKAIANKNSLVERAIELQNIEHDNRLREITDYKNTKEQAEGAIAAYQQAAQKYSTKLEPQGQLVGTITNSSPEILALLGLEKEWDNFNRGLRGQGGVSSFIGANLDDILEKIKASEDYFGGKMSVDTYEKIITLSNQYTQSVSSYDRELERASKGFSSHLQLSVQTADGYETLSDAHKNFVQDYINEFKIIGVTTKKDLQNIQQDYISFAENLADSDNAKQAINELFSLDKSKLSAADWSQQASDLVEQIAEILKLDADKLKLTLGITVETNQGGIVDNVDKMISDISSKLNISADDIGKLGIDDLKLAYTNLAELGCKSIDELIAKLTELKSANQPPLTFDLSNISDNLSVFNEEIANVYTSMDILDKAADEVTNTGKITAETFKSLSDNNLLQYLQFTATGVTVLTDELVANETAVRNKAKADLEAALFSDLLNLATTGLSDAEQEAKEKADNAGTAVETMGTKFASSVDGVLEATVAVSAFNAANGGSSFNFEGQEDQFNKLLGNYNSAISAINNMTSATNSSTNAFNRQSSAARDAAEAINSQLKAEGDAAIRVIDRHIKAIQDEQKASEKAIDAQINKIREEKEAFEDAIDAELKKLNERKQALEDSIKDYGSAADSVKDLVGEQMDAIDKKKDEVNEFYDDQLDALEKVNKELQDQIEREKSLEALQKAKSQKVLIYRKGQDFVEAENEGAVKEEQDNHDQLLADQALQAEKDRLQEERDAKLEALDDEKKLWEDYQKLWEDAATAYEREQQRLIAIKILSIFNLLLRLNSESILL